MPVPVAIGAVLAAGLGYLLAVWAMASNKFYGRYVRIQHDRGHRTITAGPYRFVRHPGYAGLCLFMLASALALESLWALVPAILIVGVLVLRTALEDRTLQAELTGYPEYARQTRYRLFPGIW
jgi:protein-S-isoprenylcysteine O-methyltransferase Ste14